MQGNPCPVKHSPGTWAPSCGSTGSPRRLSGSQGVAPGLAAAPPNPLRQNFWGRSHNLVSMSPPVSPMPSGVWRSQERWVRKVLGPDRGSKARSVTDRQARGKWSGVFYSLLSLWETGLGQPLPGGAGGEGLRAVGFLGSPHREPQPGALVPAPLPKPLPTGTPLEG